MGGFEGDTHSRKNLVFLRYKDNFSEGLCTENVTFKTLPCSPQGDIMSGASSPPGNNSRDIPNKEKDGVKYPGRSVLYSRQLRPFDPDYLH
jgi:hypothetical protein